MSGVMADIALEHKRRNKARVGLHKAIFSGDIDKVQTIVHIYPELTTEFNGDGDMLLHIAVKSGCINGALILVALNPQLAVQHNQARETPLYIAIYMDNFALLSRMLTYIQPIRVSIGIDRGKSIIHAALRKSRWRDYLEVLINHKSSLIESHNQGQLSPLSWAVRQGKVDMVVYLLRNFPGIENIQDMDDNEGSYPIHQVFKGKQFNILQAFYSHDPNSIRKLNQRNGSILHLVAKGNYLPEVLYYLHTLPEVRSLIFIRDITGRTPIDVALSKNNVQFLQYFGQSS